VASPPSFPRRLFVVPRMMMGQRMLHGLPARAPISAIGVGIARTEILAIRVRIILRTTAGVRDNGLRHSGGSDDCRDKSGTNQRDLHLVSYGLVCVRMRRRWESAPVTPVELTSSLSTVIIRRRRLIVAKLHISVIVNRLARKIQFSGPADLREKFASRMADGVFPLPDVSTAAPVSSHQRRCAGPLSRRGMLRHELGGGLVRAAVGFKRFFTARRKPTGWLAICLH